MRRILVCYDGSAESGRALARTADIASAGVSAVTVVSVAEPLYPMRPYTGYADPAEEELHRRQLDDARRTLARDGSPLRRSSRSGTPRTRSSTRRARRAPT